MKKTEIIILLVIVLIGGSFLLYFSGPAEQKKLVTNQENQETNTKQKLESKIDEQSNVTVTVTLVDISPQSKQWKFGVARSFSWELK